MSAIPKKEVDLGFKPKTTHYEIYILNLHPIRVTHKTFSVCLDNDT
jgi:hypothetical protein